MDSIVHTGIARDDASIGKDEDAFSTNVEAEDNIAHTGIGKDEDASSTNVEAEDNIAHTGIGKDEDASSTNVEAEDNIAHTSIGKDEDASSTNVEAEDNIAHTGIGKDEDASSTNVEAEDNIAHTGIGKDDAIIVVGAVDRSSTNVKAEDTIVHTGIGKDEDGSSTNVEADDSIVHSSVANDDAIIVVGADDRSSTNVEAKDTIVHTGIAKDEAIIFVGADDRSSTNVEAEADQPSPGGVSYASRAPWLRAAVAGAKEGLVSTALIMIGFSAGNDDPEQMVLEGIAELITGTLCIAIFEFISEVFDIKRYGGTDKNKKQLPSSLRAALASALAFALGALVPLLAGAFVKQDHARIWAVFAATTVGLAAFGATAAHMGGTSVARSTFRLVAAGWLAMVVTHGVFSFIGKLFDTNVFG